MKMHLNFATRDLDGAANVRESAVTADGRRRETYFVVAESEARDDEATACC